MPRAFQCPYFRRASAPRRRVNCSCGALQFPSLQGYLEYTKTYCAANPGWEKCALAQALNEEEMRREAGEKLR